MEKYKILGIATDVIKRNSKTILDKDGNNLYGAIGWYRIINPLKKLGANISIGQLVGVIPEIANDMKSKGDIWFCKMTDNEDIDHKYTTLKELTGAKFVLDLDDDIDNIDPNHPDFEALEDRKHMRVRMVKMADHIVVATEQIKQSIKHLNPYITVIPNAIDPEIWKVKSKKKKGDKIRVVWISSGSHFVDSPIIEDIMVELGKEHPNMEFVIAGMVTNEMSGQGWIHTKGTDGYKPFPQFFANLNADIAIAPLKDTIFNRAKSNIKWMEAAMLGIPVVASDVRPYDCIKHGKTGYLATTSQQFKKYVKWLIEDKELRERIGKEAKKDVLENYTIDKQLPKYTELFDKLMDKKDITVMTAITDGKDDLIEQKEYKGVEYMAFIEEGNDDKWKTKKVCDKFVRPVMNAKIHKVLGHKYCDTEYIVWMDGNVKLKQDPHELVKLMGKNDMAFFKHPGWNSVYTEADACIKLNKGKMSEIAEQMQDYIKKGYELEGNHCEMTAFIRRNDPKTNLLFEQWWAEICRYSNRDQISFPIVFKKAKWKTIPGSVAKVDDQPNYPGNDYFHLKFHNHNK